VVTLLLLGHGSSKHPDSSRSVREHAEILSQTDCFAEVRCAFLKEEPLIENALDEVGEEQVIIVPDFLAEGYFTRQVVPAKLGDKLRSANICCTPPVGTHPMMAEIINDMAREVLGDWTVEQTSLLVVGHGSGKNPCSKQSLLGHLQEVRNNTDFAQVADLWLEELPLVSSWKEVATQRHIIVIPYLLNDGQHGGWDIPAELGLSLDQQIHGQTHDVESHQIRLTPALGTSPRFAEVISQLAEIWGQTSGE
jgi:sirohydrochlorin cobaltochelatase